MLKTLVLAAAAFAAVPASAQDAATSILVPYGDLNLASSEGSAALNARVKTAARKICGVAQAPGIAEMVALKSCRASVLESARPQMTAALSRGGPGSVIVTASR